MAILMNDPIDDSLKNDIKNQRKGKLKFRANRPIICPWKCFLKGARSLAYETRWNLFEIKFIPGQYWFNKSTDKYTLEGRGI